MKRISYRRVTDWNRDESWRCKLPANRQPTQIHESGKTGNSNYTKIHQATLLSWKPTWWTATKIFRHFQRPLLSKQNFYMPRHDTVSQHVDHFPIAPFAGSTKEKSLSSHPGFMDDLWQTVWSNAEDDDLTIKQNASLKAVLKLKTICSY